MEHVARDLTQLDVATLVDVAVELLGLLLRASFPAS